VSKCVGFSAGQKKRILRKLSGRADKNGVVRVTSQKHRSQKANREAAIERLCELLKKALERKAVRKKTKIPFSAVKRRLEEKKRRGQLKKERSKKEFGYD
jgi:ribosome-associated protein